MNQLYRKEIDGLRAFAIIAVIINHFNKDILPSGYLGVDIFFVISGYVITSSIARRSNKNFWDFIIDFYQRRIKRLIPALIIFVITTSLLISFFNTNPGISIQTGLSSLFGISNLYLLTQSTDYFAPSTELNVFTHTWSLGVEEQFYFLFPFLIWITGFGQKSKKGTKNLFLILLLLSILSFISFIYLYQNNQSAAYFLMPTRFWEIATGSIVFLGINNQTFIFEKLKRIPPIFVLLAIFGVMFLPIDLAVFSTTFLVVLTSLLIICIKEKSIVFKLFTQKSLAKIGLLSYSLYLWHWGILSISRWTIGIHWWSIPFQILLIYFISNFSYKFIEIPLRKGEWSNKKWRTILNGIIALVISSVTLFGLGKPLKGKLFLGNKNKEEFRSRSRNRFTYEKKYGNQITYTGNNCHKKRDANFDLDSEFEKCFLNKKSDKTIFFVGNSHTDHFRQTHFLLSNKLNISIDGTTVSSCIFPADNNQDGCGNIQDKQYERLKKISKPGDIVVIANRYEINNKQKSYDWFDTEKSLSRVNEFSKEMKSRNVKVVLFKPTPEFKKDISECTIQWFRPFPIKGCSLSTDELIQRRFIQYQNLKKISKEILQYDPAQSLCNEDYCPMIDVFNNPIYYDSNHLTDYANENYIYSHFLAFLKKQNLI